MAEELISEYIDQAAIKAQTDFMIGEVNRVKVSYETLKKLRLDIGSSKPLSEVSAGIKAADAETQKIIKSQNLLNQAKIIEVRLANELLKQKKLQLEIDEKLTRNAERAAKVKPVAGEPISVTNLPTDQIEKTGVAVSELDIAQAQAANSATAMGNANIVSNKALKETRQSSLELNKQLELKRQLDRQAAQELRNTVREENAVKGSLEQRRAALIRLNAVYDNQSPAERASAAGQRLQRIISGLDAQVKDLEKTTGRSQRNVGNYGTAFDSVTKGATKAFSALRFLANIIPGLGIGGLILAIADPIVTLTKSLFGFNEVSEETKKQQEEIASSFKQSADNAGEEISKVTVLKAVLESDNATRLQKITALKQLKEVNADYFGQLDLENGKIVGLTKAYDSYVSKLVKSINAKANIDLLTKALKEQNDIVADINKTSPEKEGPFTVNNLTEFQRLDAIRRFNLQFGVERKKASEESKDFKDILLITPEQDRLIVDLLNAEVKVRTITQKIKSDIIGAFDAKKEKGPASEKQLSELKELVSTEFEIYKLQQEAKIRAFDADIKSDKTHYLDKLKALDEYYKASNELIVAQLEEDTRRAKQTTANDVQKLEESKRGKSLEQIARINENIKIAEQNLQQQLLLIQAQAQDKGNQLLQSTADLRNKITEDYLKKEKEFYEEFAKFEQDNIDKTNEAYRKGLEKRLAQEKEFAEKQKQLVKDLNEKKVGFALEAEKLLYSLGTSTFQRQLNAIKEEQDAIDIKKERELAANDSLVQSEEKKAANILIINERANLAKEALDRKSREIQDKQAKFQRAQQVFEILIGTIKSVSAIKAQAAILAANPITAALAPLALAQIPIVIGTGAASAAALLATPLPKFKHGKGAGNNYQGPAIVNDGNTPEVIQHSDGTFTFPEGRNVIAHIKRDDIIHPDRDAWMAAILGAANRDAAAALRMPAAKSEDKVGSAMAYQTKLLQQIANKKELSLHASDKGMEAVWKWGAKQVKYINENTNWD